MTTSTTARDRALELCRELGWTEVSAEQAAGHPIGTPEQQRVLRDGLSRSGWEELSLTHAERAALAVLAVRVGVDARRIVTLLRFAGVPGDALGDAVAARGADDAARFVAEAVRTANRFHEHAVSRLGRVVVRLVRQLGLPVPAEVSYLKDWAALVAEDEAPDDRFAEHARVAVDTGLPLTGPFGPLFGAAVGQGRLTRDEALRLAFTGLDTAVRPGDRKVWTRILVDDLAVTDAELVDRADALVVVLATGEGPVVEAFAPRLLATVPDDLVPDVLAAASTVRTKKARRAVTAAAARRLPPEALAPEPDEAPAERGRWLPAPPLAPVPAFTLGAVGPDRLTDLTDLAGLLLGRPEEVVDVETERFLALANALARTDPDGVRQALRGVPETWRCGLWPVAAWVAGEPGPDPSSVNPLAARDAAVVARLGAVPALLSTPSSDDLRIDPADLADRLRAYRAAGVAAAEADLLVALLRLDLDLAGGDGGAAVRAELATLDVPVLDAAGAALPVAAGPLAAGYLADPVVEPEVRVAPRARYWDIDEPVVPASLALFAGLLGRARWMGGRALALWPGWGEATARQLGGGYPDAGFGIGARQLARRAAPLGPGATVNLLAGPRGAHPVAAEDAARAVSEAWARGLLRPGVAEARYLDWNVVPGQLAALAPVLLDHADDGLAAVVWPVLADLVAIAVDAPRLLAGTAELAEALLALAPGAVAAVADGRAPEDVLAVPGLRALAARSGSSRAVVAARAAVALLPAPVVPDIPVPAPEPAPPADPSLDADWPAGAGSLAEVADGIALTAQWEDPGATTKMLAFDLVLPDRPGEVYRVVKGWTYDLESEGQCAATERGTGAAAWLSWDGTRMAASPHRDRVNGRSGPLQHDGPVRPLTTSMVAVALGMVGQDGERGLAGEHLLDVLAARERIGSTVVRSATRLLLTQPDVSPARLVRVLEKRRHLLPLLWPLLTEPVRAAGSTDGPPPRWLNQVLVVALVHAPALRAAAWTGRLPADLSGPDGWPGLAALAARPGKSAALGKARELRSLLT